jgi:hypothetical protein
LQEPSAKRQGKSGNECCGTKGANTRHDDNAATYRNKHAWQCNELESVPVKDNTEKGRRNGSDHQEANGIHVGSACCDNVYTSNTNQNVFKDENGVFN